MKYTLSTLLCCLFLTTLTAQVSDKLTFLANWDVDSLPSAGNNSYNDIWGFTDCEGREYAIMGSSGYTHFFDVTEPTATEEIASFEGGSVTTWRDFKTYRNRAYGVCDNCTEGLQIFDISNPQDTIIRTAQNTDFWLRSHNIYIDEEAGRLYSVGTDAVNNGVIILTLNANPDAPLLLANLPLPGGYVHDIYVRNNIAFASHGFNGLYIYDLTDPTNPITLGTITDYPEPGYNHSSWLSDDGAHLIMADETFNRGVKYINVSDFEEIEVTDVFRSTLEAPEFTNSIAHNPFIRGDLAFISYYHDGVQVWDISNPDTVVNVGYYDTDPDNINYDGFRGTWGVYPFLPSGNIIASDMRNGLFVLGSDSLNLAPISPDLNPDATIDIDGISTICEGDSVTVFLPDGAQEYEWFQNGSTIAEGTASVSINSEGLVYATAANGRCSVTSDTLEIEVQALPDATITVDDTEACVGETIIMKAIAGFDSYQWSQSDLPIPGEIAPELAVTESGMYSVKISSGFCSVISEEIEILFIDPVVPVINFDGMDINSTEAVSYQWFLNGEQIEGATNINYTPSASGAYQVATLDENGCTALSDPIEVDLNRVLSLSTGFAFQLWPNPTSNELEVRGLPNGQDAMFRVWGSNGQMVMAGDWQENRIDVSTLQPGLYLLQIFMDGKLGTHPFVKQ
ncbi:MAG: choice-of-anchor B family protein [Bacteroidota bacterium]